MDENNVNQIRKSTRELMNSNRRAFRDETFDSHRSVRKSRYSIEDITAVANKLKTKTPIAVDELKILKNGLLDNENNIKIVLSTHGALRGIVRELSGTDIQKQIEAAGCCCNLALGDSKSCMVVTKAAGTYLVTCIDSLSFGLAVNCIWALGNLAGSSSKVSEMLIAQGALGKLVHTLDGSTNQSVQDAIVYALKHFVYQMKDDLSQESLRKLITALSKLDSKIQKWHLLSLASCHHEFITSITDCEQLITDLINFLPFIEPDELERVWKASRREKTRQQEDKIFADFVRDNDVVSNVFKDDRYQFLENFADDSVKQMIEKELNLNQPEVELYALACEDPNAETTKEVSELQEAQTRGADGKPAVAPQAIIEVVDKQCEEDDDTDMFRIFDDSGPDDTINDTINNSMDSPCTVRENVSPGADSALSEHDSILSPSPRPKSSKSENLSSMIESNIYCAKVRDLRTKINEELLRLINSVDRKNLLPMDSAEIKKNGKRATEFCTRFNRVHMYQLQRHVSDIKRHASVPLPCVMHTEFLAQMTRAGSLHQSALHALQIFIKSFEQNAVSKKSADLLVSFTQQLHEMHEICQKLPTPPDLIAATGDLYNDSMVSSLDQLEKVAKDLFHRITANKTSTDDSKTILSPKLTPRPRRRLRAKKPVKKHILKVSQHPLAMYGADPQATSNVKDAISSSIKRLYQPSGPTHSASTVESEKGKVLRTKRSPRRRRPLMRDPHLGRSKSKQVVPKDNEIETMVEIIDTCRTENSCYEFSGIVTPEPDKAGKPAEKDKRDRTPVTGEGHEERWAILKSPRTPVPLTSPKAIYLDMQLPKSNNQTPRGNKPKPTPKVKFLDKRSISARSKTGDDVTIPPLALQKISHATVSSSMTSSKTKGSMKADKSGESGKEDEKVTSPDKAAGKNVLDDKLVVEDKKEKNDNVVGDIMLNPDMKCHECEVSRILKSLCGGDSYGKVTGAKNAQLINMMSSRQPSTPQLLRILEETIQKKAPKQLFNQKRLTQKQKDKLRLALSINEATAKSCYEYRTKFVNHMLTSPLYTNSAVGKPWEVIGSVSEKIIEELLLKCAKEMQIQDVILEMFKDETDIEEVSNETQKEN